MGGLVVAFVIGTTVPWRRSKSTLSVTRGHPEIAVAHCHADPDTELSENEPQRGATKVRDLAKDAVTKLAQTIAAAILGIAFGIFLLYLLDGFFFYDLVNDILSLWPVGD